MANSIQTCPNTKRKQTNRPTQLTLPKNKTSIEHTIQSIEQARLSGKINPQALISLKIIDEFEEERTISSTCTQELRILAMELQKETETRIVFNTILAQNIKQSKLPIDLIISGQNNNIPEAHQAARIVLNNIEQETQEITYSKNVRKPNINRHPNISNYILLTNSLKFPEQMRLPIHCPNMNREIGQAEAINILFNSIHFGLYHDIQTYNKKAYQYYWLTYPIEEFQNLKFSLRKILQSAYITSQVWATSNALNMPLLCTIQIIKVGNKHNIQLINKILKIPPDQQPNPFDTLYSPTHLGNHIPGAYEWEHISNLLKLINTRLGQISNLIQQYPYHPISKELKQKPDTMNKYSSRKIAEIKKYLTTQDPESPIIFHSDMAQAEALDSSLFLIVDRVNCNFLTYPLTTIRTYKKKNANIRLILQSQKFLFA